MDNTLANLDKDSARREIQRLFRTVFSTNEGREVFNIMLDDLKFFTPCSSDEDRVLNNYAKFMISERMGINGVDRSDAILDCKPEL